MGSWAGPSSPSSSRWSLRSPAYSLRSSIWFSSVESQPWLTISRYLLQLLMPAIVTHGLTVTCVRISVLLLYRRIFVTEAFRRFTLVIGALCIVWAFANVFGQVFLCSPMSAAWHPNLIFSDKCKDVQAMYYGVSISNMLLDIIILCLPLPLIWGLPLSWSKKFGLCGIFSLGSLWVFPLR